MLYGNSTYPALGNQPHREAGARRFVTLCRDSGRAARRATTARRSTDQACDVLEAWTCATPRFGRRAPVPEFWQRVNLDTVWLTPVDANDPVKRRAGSTSPIRKVKAGAGRRGCRPAPGARLARTRRGHGQYVVPRPEIPIHGGPGGSCQRDQQQACRARPAAATTCRTARAHPDRHLGSERTEGGDDSLDRYSQPRIRLTALQGHDELYSQGLGDVRYKEADILADPTSRRLHLLPSRRTCACLALSAALLVRCREAFR